MLNVRTLSCVRLVAIVADVQKILWQESHLLPEFPRELGEYWNPAKEDDSTTLEQIAEVLADADLKPPDFMPVDQSTQQAPTLLDANELLWATRILARCVRRYVAPAMSENLEVARAILDSYAEVPVFDPRDQRWTTR